jgi:hypothetical protein
MYAIAPGVFWSVVVTPRLPLAPGPVGNCTEVPKLTLEDQVPLTCER